ncbi:MAG: carbon-nitrogen hydrolase family protein [Clostridiales Family XIII bacterium]|jgi:predicted amidohydrolase|nr:carbon-nitrogen hydrolase family protein [Clostridiales Family XIII bacterium]
MKQLKDVINVAVVNFKVDAGQKENNLRRINEFSVAAAMRGAHLVLFPELSLTGYDYFVDDRIGPEEKKAMAETLAGPSCASIAETAKAHGVYIVFGMAEKQDDGADEIYNSAVAIGPDGIIGSYKKIHPFDAENKCFAKGDTPFMFDTAWGPVSIGICYDTFQFPELMRHYVAKGSRLYLNPTALIEEIPNDGSRRAFIDYYAPTLEYGVLCNTIFIASANLTGFDEVHYFGGGSAVLGPKITPFFETNVTYYAGSPDNVQEELSIATIDLSLAKRRLMDDSGAAREPDYRPELYKKFV